MPTWEELSQRSTIAKNVSLTLESVNSETLIADSRAQLSPMQMVDQKLQLIFRRKSPAAASRMDASPRLESLPIARG